MKNLILESEQITSLDLANSLIEEYNTNLFKLFTIGPACMTLTTMDRVFVKVNKKFLDLFGYEESEIIGRTSAEIGLLDAEEAVKVSHLFKEKGGLHNDIVKCTAKSGKEIHTISSINTIEIGGVSYLMSSFLDISRMVEQQKIIEKQNREIKESINYASLIQNSLLPSDEDVEKVLPHSFVLSKPKDVLSGDFYWIKKTGNRVYLAACDCTGHGVPGALISILGCKLLSKFSDEYNLTRPSEILNQISKEFSDNKFIKEAKHDLKDGMDVALCTIDLDTLKMEYAGAYNPIYLIRKEELIKLNTDKIPIHLFSAGENEQFSNYEIQLQKHDALYLFSDGYADQFGGPFGKKFQSKQFEELILKNYHLPMPEQKSLFNQTIEEWKNISEQEQTDDILVVGFKI